MKKFILLGILMVMVLLSGPTVYGADLRGAEEVKLPDGETVRDDLYVAGGAVTLSGNVVGDVLSAGGDVSILGETAGNLMVAGGNVIVSGGVGGDALIIGGDVTVLGFVRDDLRIAGGNVQVSNAVGGDIVAAGGVVHLVSGATVSRDVVVFGGQTTIDGTINGDVTVYGGELRINGTILGTLDVKVSDSLVIGKDAVINGGTYKSAKEAQIAEGATVRGELVFEEIEIKDRAGASFGSFFGVGITTIALMMLVVALIAVYATTDGMKRIVGDVQSHFWKNTGIGFVALVVAPILSLVLLLTFIGMPLGFLLGFSYMTAFLGAKLITSVVIGAIALKLALRSEEIRMDWLTAIVGVVVLLALMLIPLIGFLVVFVVFLATAGAVIRMLRDRLWS